LLRCDAMGIAWFHFCSGVSRCGGSDSAAALLIIEVYGGILSSLALRVARGSLRYFGPFRARAGTGT
jgi:hypothetical protein